MIFGLVLKVAFSRSGLGNPLKNLSLSNPRKDIWLLCWWRDLTLTSGAKSLLTVYAAFLLKMLSAYYPITEEPKFGVLVLCPSPCGIYVSVLFCNNHILSH